MLDHDPAIIRLFSSRSATADQFLLKAHSTRTTSKLKKDRVRKLYDAICAVLEEAIASKGSSISDYVDAEGKKGNFQLQHRVYRRTGEPCVRCGAPIKRTLVTQRGTHFCAKCQKR